MPIRVDCASCGKKLQVPDSTAGKRVKCPGCQAVLVVPSAGVMETEPAGIAESRPSRAEVDDAPEAGDSGKKPCPMCGEMIAAAANKCRFCGEIFDPELRPLEKKKTTSPADAEMTGAEWFFTVVPIFAIGCILGIVYMIQGKKKGGKMLGLSILFIILWNIVVAVISAALKQ